MNKSCSTEINYLDYLGFFAVKLNSVRIQIIYFRNRTFVRKVPRRSL
jgi:hypothetical protein